MLLPTQIQPGEHYVQSWKQVGDLLARLVEQNNGKVQLSSLKALFRKAFKMELSESALGHAKLSEFVQDPRLRSPDGGCFGLEQRGMQMLVVNKECTMPVEELVEQVSPADWHVPHLKQNKTLEDGSLAGTFPKRVHPPPGLVPPPGLDWP